MPLLEHILVCMHAPSNPCGWEIEWLGQWAKTPELEHSGDGPNMPSLASHTQIQEMLTDQGPPIDTHGPAKGLHGKLWLGN